MSTDLPAEIEEQAPVDLDVLVRELDAAVDYLPEEALRTCQRHRDLVTPRLIEILGETARLGREGKLREGYAHTFALYLLGEFQDQRARSVVLDLFSLKDPVLRDLLGGTVAHDGSRFLAILAGDEPDLFESMVSNDQLDEYIRWAAAAAICRLVLDHRMTRDEATERLMRRLRFAMQAEDVIAVSVLVMELGNLNPTEVESEIKAAFDAGLVDETMIDWDEFVEFYLQPAEPGACPELKNFGPTAIVDTVEEMRQWACFGGAPQYAEWSDDEEADDFYDDLDDEEDEEFDDLDAPAYFNPPATIRNETVRVGRNDACPCGSGKKYKKCCLRMGDIT
jgi:hypothetical protein